MTPAQNILFQNCLQRTSVETKVQRTEFLFNADQTLEWCRTKFMQHEFLGGEVAAMYKYHKRYRSQHYDILSFEVAPLNDRRDVDYRFGKYIFISSN